MLNFIREAIALVSVPTRYVAAAVMLLLFPWHWQKGYPYTDVALLVCAIVLLGRILGWVADKYRLFVCDRAFEKRLRSLTVAEKEVLREYIEKQAKALPMSAMNPAVASLSAEGILVRVGSLAPWGSDTTYYEGTDDGGVEYALPDGYKVAECNGGSLEIYAPDGSHCTLVTAGSGPAIATWEGIIPLARV